MTLKSIKGDALKRVHVNQHKLRQRVKDSSSHEHCYTIKHKGQTITAFQVHIDGPSTLVERIDHPLSCGARLWLETDSEITYEV